jgi:molecular chaperone GrpE (heat shock protein)
MRLRERLSKAWAGWSGNEPPGPAPEAGGPEAVLARVRLELEGAQREIGRLREAYAQREAQAKADVEAAERDAVFRFARRVGPLLSQLSTMRALAGAGREVRIEDMLAMGRKLEGAFTEAGMVPIGEVGAEAPFDPKRHQRMSGGGVKEGDPVRVRFVGYTCGDQVVTKAMVSREEVER